MSVLEFGCSSLMARNSPVKGSLLLSSAWRRVYDTLPCRPAPHASLLACALHGERPEPGSAGHKPASCLSLYLVAL